MTLFFLFSKCRVFVEYNKTGVYYICKDNEITNVVYGCNGNISGKPGGRITCVIITSVSQFEAFYPLTLVNI